MMTLDSLINKINDKIELNMNEDEYLVAFFEKHFCEDKKLLDPNIPALIPVMKYLGIEPDMTFATIWYKHYKKWM